MYFNFDINSGEEDKACWIQAVEQVQTAHHHPNGADLELRLFSKPLDSWSPTVSTPDGATQEDRKEAHIPKWSTAILEVGGFAFVPPAQKKMYSVGALAAGDYEPGPATLTITTLLSRQTPVESGPIKKEA